MQRVIRRIAAAATGAVAIAALAPWVPTASAVGCAGQVRYATSTNTLYLTAGELSLSDIPTICSAAPLVESDPTNKVWELYANLVVQNGAVLDIRGDHASIPGTVNALRLASPSDNDPLHVVSITAQYGTITIDSTKVTSWDDAANHADTDPTLPSGAATDARARAFIRALSYFDTGGVARQSRMDITNSDLGYLGWYSAESYGVAYKARGCDAAHQSVCNSLDVLGSERGSRFHNNFMGTYTFDARNMVFDGNEYDHNVMYGLDPHDDSDYLTITHNHFHDNGDHGVICSQRCDHLLIANNESDHNGIPPYLPPGDPDISDNQVHGIMIHRGVTDSIIENNYVHDQPNGAGIAVFDSMNDTIRNNTVTNNKFGLRVSVGTHDVTFQGNTVTGSSSYAVFGFQGTSDVATYGIPSGRPTNNIFTGNTFNGAPINLVRLLATDGTQFVNNTVTGTVGTVRLDASTGTIWTGSALPGTGIELITSTSASTATLRNPTAVVPVKALATGGALDVVGTDGRVAEVTGRSLFATAATTGTTLHLTPTLLGGTGPFTTGPTAVRVIPASATVQVRLANFTTTNRQIVIQKGKTGVSVVYVVRGLVAGKTYTISRDGTKLLTRVAPANGIIAFPIVENTGGGHTITVAG